jgi:hypothetical protein
LSVRTLETEKLAQQLTQAFTEGSETVTKRSEFVLSQKLGIEGLEWQERRRIEKAWKKRGWVELSKFGNETRLTSRGKGVVQAELAKAVDGSTTCH